MGPRTVERLSYVTDFETETVVWKGLLGDNCDFWPGHTSATAHFAEVVVDHVKANQIRNSRAYIIGDEARRAISEYVSKNRRITSLD